MEGGGHKQEWVNELASIWSQALWIVCFPQLVSHEDMDHCCVSG